MTKLLHNLPKNLDIPIEQSLLSSYRNLLCAIEENFQYFSSTDVIKISTCTEPRNASQLHAVIDCKQIISREFPSFQKKVTDWGVFWTKVNAFGCAFTNNDVVFRLNILIMRKMFDIYVKRQLVKTKVCLSPNALCCLPSEWQINTSDVVIFCLHFAWNMSFSEISKQICAVLYRMKCLLIN